jgi:hypothetical protein
VEHLRGGRARFSRACVAAMPARSARQAPSLPAGRPRNRGPLHLRAPLRRSTRSDVSLAPLEQPFAASGPLRDAGIGDLQPDLNELLRGRDDASNVAIAME